ncbi:MAG: hypothetical protein WBQ25_03900 [Nitrososphaeraceae archaeon]
MPANDKIKIDIQGQVHGEVIRRQNKYLNIFRALTGFRRKRCATRGTKIRRSAVFEIEIKHIEDIAELKENRIMKISPASSGSCSKSY